jgi:hypothetical protein
MGIQTYFLYEVRDGKSRVFLPDVYSSALTWKSPKFLPLHSEIKCYSIVNVFYLFSEIVRFIFLVIFPFEQDLCESNRFSLSVP